MAGRMGQTFCASVLQVPTSLGAIQKVLDRVTQAIDPYDVAIATQARQSSVNYIDETSWLCKHTLYWLWMMARERGAFYLIHPRRSKEAFAALIDDGAGILVRDGYGTSPGSPRGCPPLLTHGEYARVCGRTPPCGSALSGSSSPSASASS
jgi:transposase